ncbi:hypothetical protein CEQ21_04185 [Niallia circulans]|uniref:Lipocalin-like domain-containing protein n=1 Tax=Niallia circulans TaxID=1397 RepID=A0A553ST14_NIACI|nr:hypothetical protein CEQ21_04185 [Niallia circulans]
MANPSIAFLIFLIKFRYFCLCPMLLLKRGNIFILREGRNKLNQRIEKILSGFCGTWDLINEDCSYAFGEPPKAGTYQIKVDKGKVQFHVSWVDKDCKKLQVEFSGIPDGIKYPYEENPHVDYVKYGITPVGDFMSIAYKGNLIINEASRVLSEDGKLLYVTQKVLGSDGELLANSSVYKRRMRD